MAVSLIQSVYEAFGSGVVAPGTGVALQNRAAGFSADESHPNALGPAKRPFHTIIPGMLLEGGELLGPFGVMGGAMQPQGHVQVVRSIVDGGLDPQSALEAPRWRVGDGWEIALEPGLAGAAGELRRLGHPVRLAENQHEFGVGQAIVRWGEALLAGSDPRGDGVANSSASFRIHLSADTECVADALAWRHDDPSPHSRTEPHRSTTRGGRADRGRMLE
jgi:gamma-glutamyltranspeptidase/glutathione hydrolase